jgi:hypothetical protein
MLLLGPPFAVVVTNQRVFEIRLRRLTARPNMALATHTRESVTAERTRDAIVVGMPTPYGGGEAGPGILWHRFANVRGNRHAYSRASLRSYHHEPGRWRASSMHARHRRS